MASDDRRSNPSLHVLLARAAADGKPISREEWDAADEEDSGPRVGAAVGHAAVEATLAIYAPHDRSGRRIDPSSPTEIDIMSMEEEIGKVTKQQYNLPPRQRSNGRTDFVHLAEQVAQAMVQSAEEQVAKATAILEQTRRDAETLMTAVKDKDRELADMTQRIAVLGEQVLEANRAFHAAATQDVQQDQP
jgi:hypothetical protein